MFQLNVISKCIYLLENMVYKKNMLGLETNNASHSKVAVEQKVWALKCDEIFGS